MYQAFFTKIMITFGNSLLFQNENMNLALTTYDFMEFDFTKKSSYSFQLKYLYSFLFPILISYSGLMNILSCTCN